MQLLKTLALLVAISHLCGCGKDTPSVATGSPAVPNDPPETSSDQRSQFTEQEAPDFDPKLTLAWPGTPEESRRRINAGQADETTIYSATFFSLQSGPVTIFSASVYEFTDNDLQDSDLKELLTSHGSSGDEVELTRKEIEHGPKKHLGCDVTAKDDAGFLRRVTVMDGRRIYSVQVNSLMQERLSTNGLAHEARWKEQRLSKLAPGRYILRVHLQQSELFAITLR